ncbi:MAG TPA: hypothetical protein VJ044_00970, partial [Candidatus Hodarchaeales archaeon]|nr:hypothetical protein [Candidatus Hodarchaeales archaeon]
MIIVKIGGGASINLPAIVADLSTIQDSFIIVHGGNALRDELAVSLGYQKQTLTSVSGHTSVFTDQKGLDIMLMAYAGLQNKRIVELCQKNGINAVGLTGLDGRLVQGRRNVGIRVRENGKTKVKHDYSGKPSQTNDLLFRILLENKFVPVVTVPILDEENNAINSENDDIVALIHRRLHAEKIIHLIEAPGLMRDPKDPTTTIETLTLQELSSEELNINGRMKRKLYAIKKILEHPPAHVVISDGRTE